MKRGRWQKWVKRLLSISLAFLLFWWIVIVSPKRLHTPPSLAQSVPIGSLHALQLEQEGRSFYEIGQFQAAATAWQDAASGFAQSGDPLSQAGSLNYLSMALFELGQWEEAQAAVEEAIQLLEDVPEAAPKTGSDAILAQALNNRGRIQLALGDAAAALETWHGAIQAYESLDDNAGRLGVLVNQGMALQHLGLYRRAKATLEEANPQIAALSNPELQAAGLRNLGIALQVAGDLHRSQIVLEQSWNILQTLSSSREKSATLTALGNTARSLQNFEAALTFYRQAAQVAEDLSHEAVAAQLNELNLLVELQDGDNATKLVQTLQQAILQLSPSRSQVYAAVNWADSTLRLRRQFQENTEPPQVQSQWVALGIPDAPAIAEILFQALLTARKINDPKAEAYALGGLGTLYADSQQWQDALDVTQKALLLAEQLYASEMTWKWEVQLGQIFQQQQKIDNAILAYTEAVKTLSGLRQDLVAMNPDLQFSFRNQVEPVYRELVGLLLQSPTQDHLIQARETMEALNLAELDNFFREACLTTKPVAVDRIDPQAAAIYPILLNDPTFAEVRLEVILSVPEQPLFHVQTRIPQAEFENAIARFRQSLSLSFPKRDRLQLYETFYNWLIRPWETELKEHDIQRLVFILDGSLRNLPMSVLYDGDQYLIEKYAVALTPGLQILEPRGLDDTKLKAFVGGISESRQGFPALPEVESEINYIGQEIAARVKIDGDFTTEAVKLALSENVSSILHFATHGQFSSNAEDTFILTWDGRVNVSEMATWLGSRDETRSEAIELLVLSACQTARGDSRAVLGLAGFAVKSGARSTLATLWSVRDESTAILMAQFYRDLTLPNSTKSEALRQAQLSLLHHPQYNHPFYWAPFVLVGNWL